MTLVTYDFESIGDGVAATQANTGIAPNNPSPGTGGSIVGTSDSAVGSRALLLTNGTTQACMMPIPLAASTKQAISIVTKLPASLPPSADYRVFAIFAGGSNRGYVVIKPAGTLRAGGSGGSGEASMIGGASVTPYLGTYVRFEAVWDSGTTTTDGSFKVRMFPSAFSTSQVGTEYSATGINTGAGATTTQLQAGCTTVQTTVNPITLDWVATNDGATAYNSAPGAPVAPSVNAGADQYPDAGTTATLSSTESGTFSSGTWSCTSALPSGVAVPAIATPSAASTTVSLPNPGVFTFRRRLVWSGGNQDDEVVCWVHPVAGQDIQVLAEVSGTANYSNDGGATSRVAALNDSSQSTGIASLDNPANGEIKLRLLPMALGPIQLLVEGYARSGSLASRTVTLYAEDGTTVLDTWTETPGVGIGAIAEVTEDVDSTGLAALTTLASRRALVVGIKATV